MKRPKKKRSFGRGGYLAGVSLLALALVILFNLIVGQLPSNWLEFDLTDNGLYEISDTSREFLSTLDQDVEIVVLAEEGATDARITKFLDRYTALSSHLSLTYVDPVAHPEEASAYEADSDSLVVQCEATGKSRAIPYSDIITSLTWTSAQANLTLTCETVEAETDSGDASTDSSADSETETTQVWLANGVEVDQNNADFISLMAQLSQLSFSGCYDYHGQAQTRTDCGLDDPTGVLTVSYGDGQTMTLTLGALDETGSAWYALLDEDPIIYLIQSKTISTLTGLSAPYFAEE